MASRKDRKNRAGGRGRPQGKYSPGGRQPTPWDNDPYVLSGLSEEAAEQRRMKALLRARRQLSDDLERTNDRLERTLVAKKKRMQAHLKRTEHEIQQAKFMEESGFIPATSGFQSGRVTPPSAAEATAQKWNGNSAAYRMALARKPRTATGAAHGDVSRLGQLMWQANYNPRSSTRDAYTPRILKDKDPLERDHHRPRGEFSEYMKASILKHVNVKASGHG